MIGVVTMLQYNKEGGEENIINYICLCRDYEYRSHTVHNTSGHKIGKYSPQQHNVQPYIIGGGRSS